MPDQDFRQPDPAASAKSLREGARFAAPVSSTGPNAAPELDANNPRVDRGTVTPTPAREPETPSTLKVNGDVLTEATPAKKAKRKALKVTGPVLSEVKEPPEPTELSDAVKAKLLELGHPLPGAAPDPALKPPVTAPGPPAEPGPLPAAVRLVSHYGYWLEHGEHEGSGRLLKYWSEGAIERDSHAIAELHKRGAPIAPHKE